MYRLLVGLLILIGAFTTSAVSALADATKAVVDQDDQVLRQAPGGAAVVPIKRGTTVNILESKEDWVKVSVEGWIRNGSLRAAEERSAGGPTAISNPVEILGFTVEKMAASGSKPAQAQIKLKIRNNLSVPLSAWKAIMVVQKQPSELLFSSAVSDDRPFPAGATAEVKYYWEDSEPQYSKLVSVASDQLKLSLLKIEVTKQ